MSDFARRYLDETAAVVARLDVAQLERLVAGLARLRERGGRLFVIGVGGSAGNASHAVSDLRKLAELEAYAPTDNVCELSARVNDEGWESSFARWLEGSRLGPADGLLVLSVGGGDRARNISPNIVQALELARRVGAAIYGIVGKDGGATRELGDECVVIPPLVPERITPHTEGLCSVLLHLLVSHPALKRGETKWESTEARQG